MRNWARGRSTEGWCPTRMLRKRARRACYGLVLFRELQNNPATQAIPVVLLTAKVQAVDLAQFAQLGVAGVIAKPFDPLTLAQQVASTLGWQS